MSLQASVRNQPAPHVRNFIELQRKLAQTVCHGSLASHPRSLTNARRLALRTVNGDVGHAPAGQSQRTEFVVQFLCKRGALLSADALQVCAEVSGPQGASVKRRRLRSHRYRPYRERRQPFADLSWRKS
jgi:hypothetical protein